MKFIIMYGCDSVGREWAAVDANDYEEAYRYAEQSAIEYRASFEGFHGILTFEEFCEENENDDYEEAVNDFFEYIQNEIRYSVEEYDESNEDHQDVLFSENGLFSKI